MILAQNKKENKKSKTSFVERSEIVGTKQAQNTDLSLLSNIYERDMQKTFSHTAHEIRNPIAAMELHSRIILKKIEMGQADNAITSIECIMNSLGALKGIADGLSSFSKGVELSKQKANISILLKNVVEIMRPAFEEKKVELNLIENGIYVIQLDANKIQQVLINLLKNALEATEAGGKVDVWIESFNDICVLVKDTGSGVSERNREKIFYPNFTTKKTGSGIGLCESRKIARAHNGNVVLQETSAKGSTFALRLPA